MKLPWFIHSGVYTAFSLLKCRMKTGEKLTFVPFVGNIFPQEEPKAGLFIFLCDYIVFNFIWTDNALYEMHWSWNWNILLL